MAEEIKEEEEKEVKAQPEAEKKPLMVQDILQNYPADRDGARDSMILAISTNLNRIANALEYFANIDIAQKKANEITKH